MRRRLNVYGKPVGAQIVVSESMKTIVVFVPHGGEVVVVFIGSEPRACVMSDWYAEKLKSDLRWIDQAYKDDEKIAEMEADFDE